MAKHDPRLVKGGRVPQGEDGSASQPKREPKPPEGRGQATPPSNEKSNEQGG